MIRRHARREDHDFARNVVNLDPPDSEASGQSAFDAAFDFGFGDGRGSVSHQVPRIQSASRACT